NAGAGRLHEGHAERDRERRGVSACGGRLPPPHAGFALADASCCESRSTSLSDADDVSSAVSPRASPWASTFFARLRARRKWAIVDSNHGPPPYQSGALTD